MGGRAALHVGGIGSTVRKGMASIKTVIPGAMLRDDSATTTFRQ